MLIFNLENSNSVYTHWLLWFHVNIFSVTIEVNKHVCKCASPASTVGFAIIFLNVWGSLGKCIYFSVVLSNVHRNWVDSLAILSLHSSTVSGWHQGIQDCPHCSWSSSCWFGNHCHSGLHCWTIAQPEAELIRGPVLRPMAWNIFH